MSVRVADYRGGGGEHADHMLALEASAHHVTQNTLVKVNNTTMPGLKRKSVYNLPLGSAPKYLGTSYHKELNES